MCTPGNILARIALATGALLLLTVAPRPAAGSVPVCVSFHGPSLKNPQGYQRLLESELRHHPTHHVVRRGCSAKLQVEYIQLDKTGYLTGRLRGGIPHRVKVRRIRDIPQKLREMVAFLLKLEPVYLVENLASSGLLSRPKQTVLKYGRNFFGLELYQLLIWARGDMSPLAGAAFRFRRSTERWFLGARVEFAYRPAPLPTPIGGNVFRMFGAAQIEVGLNLLPDAVVSPYISGLAGVAWYHVHGPVEHQGQTVTDELTSALFGVSVRVGLELLRLSDVRLDIYAMVNVPLHKTKNVDSLVIDAYTPSLQIGCGVSF
jgi:hypothetical protein